MGFRVSLRSSNPKPLMSALGLGRVETHWIRVPESMGAKKRLHFLGPHYALIAAMSGWIPMMFITRVRL